MYFEINMEMKKEILSNTQPPKLKQEVKHWKNRKYSNGSMNYVNRLNYVKYNLRG